MDPDTKSLAGKTADAAARLIAFLKSHHLKDWSDELQKEIQQMVDEVNAAAMSDAAPCCT